MTSLSRRSSWLLMAAIIVLPGCSTSSLLKTSGQVLSSPARMIAATRKNRPVAKVLCLWEAAEGQGLDGKPARGFAGQIMFFTHGDPSPVRVNGKVRIFEYTDYDSEAPNPRPEHLFEFDAAAWNAHIAEGTIGETYNVFLPYVKKHKGHAVCALRLEYEDADGRVTSSPFHSVTLASKSSLKTLSDIHRHVVQQQTSEPSRDVSVTENAKPAAKKLESTTIKLPGK